MLEASFENKKLNSSVIEYLENIIKSVKANAIVLTLKDDEIIIELDLNKVQDFNILLIKKYGNI